MAAPSPPSFVTPLNLTFEANRVSGRHANIFQPPKSPPSSSTNPFFTTPRNSLNSGSRKRPRRDSTTGTDSTAQWTTAPSSIQCPTLNDGSNTSATESGYGQHSVLVNERYKLKGGFDTPSLLATAKMEEMQPFGDFDQRTRLRDGDIDHRIASESTPIFGALARERNGVGRAPTSPNGEPQRGWTGFAFSVVGKVFTFGTSVVRGFYAGDGKGYDLKDRAAHRFWRPQQSYLTPLPGSWQDDEFLGDFEQDNPERTPASTSRPPNKRRQTDRDAWVMVGTPDVTDSSLRRKSSSTSIPRSTLATARPTASRASSRRSIAPLSRRQSSHVSHSGSPTINTPSLEAFNRRASLAPTRSPNSRPGSSSGNAHISPEAERYIKRRAKQEKQADAAMSDMSRKLADLIRQGQQALGTKISVEGIDGGGEDTDEGFVDEDY